VIRTVQIIGLLIMFALGGYLARQQWWSEPAVVASDAGKPTAIVSVPSPDYRRLPEFSLQDLRGESRSISEWANKPLLINFWATWCAPCLREMPMLEALHQEREQTAFEVIGIAIDRKPDVEAFIAESGITYSILTGESDAMEAAQKFGPDFVALPFTVFASATGEVLLLHSGELHLARLQQVMAIMDALGAGQITTDQARTRLLAEVEQTSG
jgi:thiol-disulfide isomerase/thioredoxin